MSYKALYRTYRPSTFDEVAGQKHIVKTIKNALKTGKIAHAYLFAGPRGTGKTTMAKLLAKALNCEEGVGCQCNECKNCKAINDGTHPDVLEIDAASNNGVDEIRDLIDKVKYGTVLGKKKVYIIDEVHMLTDQAFNALLKTLEEPPEHVIFILATTEPHEILPTILSRCQRYDFTKLSDDEIKERIRVVLKEENIEFNDEAVDLVVSLSDGGMRDALSILDQVLAFSGNSLNEEDILEMFSLESKEEKINLLLSIANGDVATVLSKLNHYITKGTDIKRLTNDLLNILKDLLIYISANNVDYLQAINKDDAEKLLQVISKPACTKMIDMLLATIKDFKSVTSINSLFEITLLKMASSNTNDLPKEAEIPLKPAYFEEKRVEKPIIKPEPVVAPQPIPVPQPEPVFEGEAKPIGCPLILASADAMMSPEYEIDDKTMIDIIVSSKKEIKNKFLDEWVAIKKFVTHPKLGKAASMLVDAHILVASKKIIVLELPLPKNVSNVNQKDNQVGLQTVLFNAFGQQMFVYALTRVDSVRLQKEFLDRKQINTLPKIEDINLEFIGE